MRQAGLVVAHVKRKLRGAVRPGITTQELDRIAEAEVSKLGAQPSFKGYRGFPATICVSLNEEIVHGIPGARVIRDGDIVSLDVGAVVGGFHADSAFTMAVGEVSEAAKGLILATEQALRLGIAQAVEGARVGAISEAVQTYAEGCGFSVVREYFGHGVGRALHEEPSIPNFGTRDRGPLLRCGMTIAIEPMLNVGGWRTSQQEDGWTVVTADGSLSAHFEDTVAITERGPEVVTAEALAPEGGG